MPTSIISHDVNEISCDRLKELATLVTFEHADHGFHVPAHSGRTDDQVRRQLIDALGGWILRVAG